MIDDIAQHGDVFSMKGPMHLGGGLTAHIDHSQKWQYIGDGQLRPVVIDTMTLRNGWTVKFTPRAMRPGDFK